MKRPLPSKAGATREMEVYAGFLEYTDHHVGRLVDSLKKLNLLDDTLIYYIIGDNGSSAEGTLNGTYNELISLNGASAWRRPNSYGTAEQAGRPKNLTITTLSAGRSPWIRRTSGPSKSPRIGVERATERSCTGPKESQRKANPQPVPSRDRRGVDNPGGGWSARTCLCKWSPAEAF